MAVKVCSGAQYFLLPILLLILVLFKKPVNSQQAGFVPCAAMPGLVPVYFDPSVRVPSNSIELTPPVAPCPTCRNVQYYADSGQPALFNGGTISGVQEIFTPSPRNKLIRLLTCPNWCLCRLDGICVQSNSGDNSAGIYPLCIAVYGGTDCAAYFFAVQNGATPGSIRLTDGTIQNLIAIPNTGSFSFAPVITSATSRITTASCNGCNFPIDCADTVCFSADSKIRTINGQTKRMDQLHLNDWVLAANESRVVYSPVQFWLHRMPERITNFQRIELENGKVLKLTPKHYLYKFNCKGDRKKPIDIKQISERPVFAQEVRPGDCVYHLAVWIRASISPKRVMSVSIVQEQGIYAPMTGEGNILVEDTLTSCQTNLDSPNVQQNFFKMTKSWPIARWLFYQESTKQNTVELSTGIDLILNLLEYIFPKSMIKVL